MFQPFAPEAAQQQHFGIARPGGEPGRVLGVGVVLDVGQDDQVLPFRRRAGGRVKVPHHGVGPAAQGRAVAVARITGDQVVVRPQQPGQRRTDRAGRNNDAARHSAFLLYSAGSCHLGCCQSLTSFTSSYMAQ